MNDNYLHTLLIYQQRYFEILQDFFISATGQEARKFADLNEFGNTVRRLGETARGNTRKTNAIHSACCRLEENLRELYVEEGLSAFTAAKNLDACKLNLGGSSRFYATQLNATRKALLFSDTVLIPDPIMPWLEKEREEERFRHVMPLQMAFFVLHLSDLIGSEFDIPPFFIFPSWEKTLENHDQQTQRNTLQLIAEVFSYHIDSSLQSLEGVIEFADKYPDEFLQKVEKTELFVPQGGIIGGSITDAIENYQNEMRQWRSESWCERHFSMGNARLVINGICERIQPIYHLIENSDELRSHPFLCVDAQAHYYQLVAGMKNNVFSASKTSDVSTNAILKSLTSSRLDFLANIDDAHLVQLRKTNENIQFRRELRELVNTLPKTKINDLGYVASEICSHIELVISKYEKYISSIESKYLAKHKFTALIGMGTLGVTLFPVLAPFLGALLPLGLVSTVGKYIPDKLNELAEKNEHSHSMMGIMSLAKKKDNE